MKRLLILSLLFLLSKQFSFAQAENFNSKVVPVKTGVLINFVSNKHLFSLTINGKVITPVSGNGVQKYLNIDGDVLQFLIVPFPEKMDYLKLNTKQKQDFLLDYEGYEMESIKSDLNVADLNEKLRYLNLNGNLFLFWVYDMPKQYKDIHQQCYLITVCFDQMLVLNSPVQKNISDTMEFLLNIGKSLKMDKR